MKPELDDKLCKMFPYMFKERYQDPRTTCMCWGFSCDDGWYNILETLCSSIDNHIKWMRKERAKDLLFNRKLKKARAFNDPSILYTSDSNKWHIKQCDDIFHGQEFRGVTPKVHRVVVEQVKEKFGTLRFYYRGGDQYVEGLVSMAEAMSAVTCEVCGSPGTLAGKGYISTKCEAHK